MKMAKLEDVIKPQKPWEVEGVEWREVKIREVVEDVKSGFALSKQKRRKIDANSGIPQLRLYNIANWNKINLDELTYIPKSMEGIEEYFIRNEDVLFNNTNSIELVGRAVVYKELNENYTYSTYSNHITRIRVKKTIIIPDFLSWYINFLWSKGFFYLKATKWIGQAGISNKKLLSIKIPLPFRNGKPDLETQKKIVEYIEANFSRIDKILEKKKKELEQLDELWESILDQAFKPKGGEEWGEVRLGEVAEHFMGGTPKTTVDEYWNGNIPWISAKELSNNDVYITKPTRYITEKGLKESNARVAPKDSILLVTTASLGNVAIAGINLAINQQITAIVPKNGVWFKYLYYYLSNNATRLLLRGQTTFKHINQKMVRKLPVLIPFRNNQPDLEKQKEIANYLDGVYEKIKALKEKIQKQITQLEEMKESILDEVFNHDEAQ